MSAAHFIEGDLIAFEYELWFPVVGYTGKYSISTIGRIRSEPWAKRPFTQILTLKIDSRYGYPYVDLWKDSKSRRFYIHILMLAAFRGKRPRGMEGRHLDDVKTNCRLSNLVYGTRSQNLQDSYRNNPALRIKLAVSQKARRRREAFYRR